MSSSKSAGETRWDTRLILAALWVARMLSGLQADTFRLNDRDKLLAVLEQKGPVVASKELLLVMSILMFVPILMSVLTLILKHSVSRWANRVTGVFFALFDLVFLVLCIFVWRSDSIEILWCMAYLIFTAMVALYAWRWPKDERALEHFLACDEVHRAASPR